MQERKSTRVLIRFLLPLPFLFPLGRLELALRPLANDLRSPLEQDLLGVLLEAVEEDSASRDVVDEAHNGGGGPHTGIDVAVVVDAFTADTGDEL
jgi:hypothetical protein